MRTVWKYALNGWGPAARIRHDVPLPENAKLLSLQNQQGTATLWAEVDTEAAEVRRTFEWFGTGHSVPPHASYVGTLQVHNGDLVFHLYEVTQ